MLNLGITNKMAGVIKKKVGVQKATVRKMTVQKLLKMKTLTMLGEMTRASMIVGLTMMISALVVAETIT
jgi:hypothetical protein